MPTGLAKGHRHFQLLLKAWDNPQLLIHTPRTRPSIFISTSCQCLRNQHSVSFGPETDKLIQSYDKKSVRKDKRSKNKVEGQDTALGDLSTGSIEITLDDGGDAILATKASAFTTTSREAIEIHPHTNRGIASSERTFRPAGPSRRSTSSKVENISKRNGPIAVSAEQSRPTQQRRTLRRSEPWQTQKDALTYKFGEEGWNPRKRLSPDAIEGLRQLHAEDPQRYSTPILAQQFKISAEAIRRILKSKWRPDDAGMEDRRQRWARRHDRIWDHKAALGLRPQRRKDRAPEGPEAFDEEVAAKKMLGHL